MKKFSEIEYVRPDMVAEQERIKEYTEAVSYTHLTLPTNSRV